MKASAQIVIGAALVAAAFFIGRMSVGEGRQSAAIELRSPEPAPKHEPSGPAPILDDTASRERKPVATEPAPESKPAPPPHDVDVNEALAILAKAMKEHPTKDPSDQTFAEKYKNTTAEELHAAVEVLRKLELEARNKIIEQRWNDGLYKENVPGDGSEPPSVHGGRGEPQKALATRQQIRNGQVVTQSTIVSADEYPDWGAMQAEAIWVSRKLHSLGRPPPNK